MKDFIIQWLTFYVVMLGACVYRWSDVDVYLVILVVTGVMLTLFPLLLLSRRKVFIAWLSKYQLYPYNIIALALVPMVMGILIISSQLK